MSKVILLARRITLLSSGFCPFLFISNQSATQSHQAVVFSHRLCLFLLRENDFDKLILKKKIKFFFQKNLIKNKFNKIKICIILNKIFFKNKKYI